MRTRCDTRSLEFRCETLQGVTAMATHVHELARGVLLQQPRQRGQEWRRVELVEASVKDDQGRAIAPRGYGHVLEPSRVVYQPTWPDVFANRTTCDVAHKAM